VSRPRDDAARAGGRHAAGAARAAAREHGSRVAPLVADSRVGNPASWWKHFLVWAIVLSIPCWVLADAYHTGLMTATSVLLGVVLPRRPTGEIEVHAAHALGIFAAMCLASTRAPLGRRLRAILIGVPTLMGIELLTGIIAIQAQILDQTGNGLPSWVLDFLDQALSAPPWLGAPLLWLLLLGSTQLQGRRAGNASRRTH